IALIFAVGVTAWTSAFLRYTKKLGRDTLTVSVRDTGVGMSAEQVENLFAPGRVNTTRGTNKEPGTGIGLILAKEMVAANSGDIRVESEPDKGSTFLITVPAAGIVHAASLNLN
ncbi:MAG TPA: ATP-binding protein, partial [Chryseosolibacter sp.]|nr:ATP-binding protein [Chryseosolibacter sp.]